MQWTALSVRDDFGCQQNLNMERTEVKYSWQTYSGEVIPYCASDSLIIGNAGVQFVMMTD